MMGKRIHNNKLFFAQVLALAALLFSSNSLLAADCLQSKASVYIKPPGVDQPSDMAFGPTGDIYLADGVNNRVVVLAPDGRLKFSFGESGVKEGEFQYPVGIDVSKNGRVFVADTGNHRIQVFESNGDFSHMFPVHISPGERPADPVDVLALELEDFLFVSDNDNHKIKVHKQSGEFQFEWGGFGEERGEFRYPGILAANEYNQVFVVDVLNTRVQMFDPRGNFIAEIGSWGVSPGDLFKPKGVAVDRKNRVFVSDSYMGCVQVFTDLGGFIGIVCDGTAKKKYVTPVGIAIDARDRLHVVEMRANRINISELKE